MNRVSTYIITLSLALPVSQLIAQIPAERKYDLDHSVLRVLESAVHLKYGVEYRVAFHLMDSLIAHSRSGKISDPFGTLRGCILFSAWMPRPEDLRDSVVTGMFKDGHILWDDFPGTKAGFGGALLATRDLNNDGKIEILESRPDFTLMTRHGSCPTYLWILTWDGTAGKIINDIDSTTHQSVIVSADDIYEFIDSRHDHVLDILGTIPELWQEDFPTLRPESLPTIVYTWNGSKYGYWQEPR